MEVVELTCPCCDRIRSVKEPELSALRKLQATEGNKILCSYCWQVFIKLLVRIRKRKHDSTNRETVDR